MFARAETLPKYWIASLVGVLALLAGACTSASAPTGPAAAPREGEQVAAVLATGCRAEEFRRLPFGLKWDCPPADFKPVNGTSVPIDISGVLDKENIAGAKRGGIFRLGGTAAAAGSRTNDPFRDLIRGPEYAGMTEGLLKLKPGAEIVIEPQLAERWERSADGKVYTFFLRKGVKFHKNIPGVKVTPDDGRELNAKDVVETYSYGMGWKDKDYPNIPGTKFPRAGLFVGLTKVEAVDNYTVRMTLDRPSSEFLVGVADGRIGIHPAGTTERNPVGDLNTFPGLYVGTGPFILQERDTMVRDVWVKNPDYWDIAPDGKPYPYLDGVTQFRLGDSASITAAVIAGQLDLLASVDDREMDAIPKANPSLRAIALNYSTGADTMVNFKHTQFNVVPGIWAKPEARWALHLMRDHCKQGETLQPKSFRWQLYISYYMAESRSQEELGMMPGLRCKSLAEDAQRLSKDADRKKAVELLTAIGYPKGFIVKDFNSQGVGGKLVGHIAYPGMQNIAGDLNQVMPEKYGLTNFKMEQIVQAGDTGADANWDINLEFDTRTTDRISEQTVSQRFHLDFHTNGGRNYARHTNDWNDFWKTMYNLDNMTFDKMWETQAVEVDPVKRQRMIYQLEHYLVYNMVYIPKVVGMSNFVIPSYVKAWTRSWRRENSPYIKEMKFTWLDK